MPKSSAAAAYCPPPHTHAFPQDVTRSALTSVSSISPSSIAASDLSLPRGISPGIAGLLSGLAQTKSATLFARSVHVTTFAHLSSLRIGHNPYALLICFRNHPRRVELQGPPWYGSHNAYLWISLPVFLPYLPGFCATFSAEHPRTVLDRKVCKTLLPSSIANVYGVGRFCTGSGGHGWSMCRGPACSLSVSRPVWGGSSCRARLITGQRRCTRFLL